MGVVWGWGWREVGWMGGWKEEEEEEEVVEKK